MTISPIAESSGGLGRGRIPGEAEFVPAAGGGAEDSARLLRILGHERATTPHCACSTPPA
ncbi:hypothetical protein [Lentzea sp. NBRC 102530]|uniref:hypothetical protein n=1 Tax=Lentzea sp. NBRC 102530 TaxID=3032201 RepID=UPI0024A3610F|nr:hypothetical protein [Lentzea sp. NBRC 102530]GLY50685.1 hypothetical protein Lesp01_43410 [Lentzea sp. NBRC 102530]